MTQLVEYTVNFQRHPDPRELIRRLSGQPGCKVILRGDAAGYEDAISALETSGVVVDDRTVAAAERIANQAISNAKR